MTAHEGVNMGPAFAYEDVTFSERGPTRENNDSQEIQQEASEGHNYEESQEFDGSQ